MEQTKKVSSQQYVQKCQSCPAKLYRTVTSEGVLVRCNPEISPCILLESQEPEIKPKVAEQPKKKKRFGK